MPQDNDPIDINAMNQNFQKLDDEVNIAKAQVGDVLFTYRKDLGDDWVECNGQSFDPEVYPELAAKCPGYEKGVTLERKVSIANIHKNYHAYFPEFASTDEYDVIVANETGSGATPFTLLYSKDGFKTHGSTTLNDNASRVLCVGGVFYVNGYWICVMHNDYQDKSYHTKIAAFKSIENPQFTFTTAIKTANIYYIYGIEYYNGNYYMICKNKTVANIYPCILKSSTPSFDTYQQISLPVHASLTGAMTWSYASCDSCKLFVCTISGKIRAIYAIENFETDFKSIIFSDTESPAYFQSADRYKIFHINNKFVIMYRSYTNASSIIRVVIPDDPTEIVAGNYDILEYSLGDDAVYSAPYVYNSPKQFVFGVIKRTNPTMYGVLTGQDILNEQTWRKIFISTGSDLVVPANNRVNTSLVTKEILYHINNNPYMIYHPEYFIPKITSDNTYVFMKVK